MCQNYSPPEEYHLTMLTPLLDFAYDVQRNPEIGNSSLRSIVPFLACGDLSGLDSDQSYPLSESKETQDQEEYQYHEPNQKPINPPYKAAIDRVRQSHTQLTTENDTSTSI